MGKGYPKAFGSTKRGRPYYHYIFKEDPERHRIRVNKWRRSCGIGKNSRVRWTEEDCKIVMDEGLNTKKKARLLGRSIYAVMRKKWGIKVNYKWR